MALPVVDTNQPQVKELISAGVKEIANMIFKSASVSITAAAKAVTPSIPEMVADITEDLHEHEFLAGKISHSTEEGTGNDDHDKTGSQNIAIELGVDELHSQKLDLIGCAAIRQGLRGQGIVKNRKDGRCDDQ